MEDFGVEKPRITKLVGLNYKPWSVQVQRLLVAYGLWEVVSRGRQSTKETETGPATQGSTDEGKPEDPKSRDSELKEDARASTIIMSLCSQDTLQHILLLATAKEQWDALKSLYQPLGLQQLGAKIQAFTAYVPPKERASVTIVATELSTLQAEIGDIDPKERPSENAKIAVLLRAVRALDTRFDPLILQLEISDMTTNYSLIVSKLTEFERRMGSKEVIKEEAFKATDTKRKPRFQGKCFNCGKLGHRARDCRALTKERNPEERSPSTGPLPTPSGGRGLSLGPSTKEMKKLYSMANAQYAMEQSWAAYTKAPQAFRDPEDMDELLWAVDSGASRHMTYCRDAFTKFSVLSKPILIQTASGAELQAVGQGTVLLKVLRNGNISLVALNEVLYAPGLAGSLISVSQLQNKGITIRTTTGKGSKRLLIERESKLLGEAELLGKSYTLRGISKTPERAMAAVTDTKARLWHRRLGHLSLGSLQHVHDVTTGLNEPVKAMKEPCEPCILAKTVRVVNREGSERATEPLARLHLDFWGPYSVSSLYGNHYFASFTDEATRMVWVFFSKDRASIRSIFIEFKARVELESGHKIQAVRLDNAPEFKALAEHYRPYGIRFEFITPYFHQQNGVPERLNRTLVTVARAMLQDARLPEQFWQDAIATACYIRNRTPVGPKGITPVEAYSGKKPYVGHLRAWGCLSYPHIPLERRRKMEPTAGKACFIGYMPTNRQYKLYDLVARKVIVSTAPKFREDKRLQYNWGEELLGEAVVVFDPWEVPDETKVPKDAITGGVEATGLEEHLAEENLQVGDFEPETESQAESNEELVVDSNAEDTIIVEVPEEAESNTENSKIGIEEPRRSGRVRAPPQRFQDQALAALAGPMGPEQPKLPKTEAEALADPLWKEAIMEELTKLQALGTWEYAKLPKSRKVVGCKWVFTVKYTPTGLIDRYKARLVAQGFSQLLGDDYLETFSPTIRAESLRTLLAIGALEDLEIRQIDVVSAYPRAKLHATIYMKPLKALKAPEETVLLLKKPLYGLKQSGREWYLEACRGLETLGFRPCFSDLSIFVTEDRSLIIGLYVDDMLILGKDPRIVDATIQGIKSLWEIKDLGDVSLILGLNVKRDRALRTLKISQTHYIRDLIKRFGL